MGSYKGILGGIDTMMAADRLVPWHYDSNKERVKLLDMKIESGRQALTVAKCDWRVKLTDLATYLPDHEGADDFFIVEREDRAAVLGVHQTRYKEIQNEVIADLADAVIEAAKGSHILTAGSLYGGKVVWMLVELPDSGIILAGRETHKRYVLIVTSHDATIPLSIRSTRVRVLCMNTMSMAVGGSRAEYVIRHTTNALDYVEEAKAGLRAANANELAMDATIERLIDTELSGDDFMVDIVPQIMDRDRPEKDGRSQTMYDEKFAAIMACYDAEHNEAIVDTAWGAVNAVNEYEEWGITPRDQEQHERQMGMLVKGQYPLTRKALALVG